MNNWTCSYVYGWTRVS